MGLGGDIAEFLLGPSSNAQNARSEADRANAELRSEQRHNEYLSRTIERERALAVKKDQEHRSEVRDIRNKADDDIRKNTDVMNDRMDKQELRFDRREQDLKESIEEHKKSAAEELDRNREENKIRSQQQAAMFNKRENDLTSQIEDTKKTAQNEKNAVMEQFQKDTEKLKEENRNDSKFNRQILDGVLHQQNNEMEELQKGQKANSDRLHQTLEDKSKELENLRQTLLNTEIKHNDAMNEERQRQATRAKEQDHQRYTEVTTIRNANEEEKLRIAAESEKRGEQLSRQLESDMAKAWEERKNNIRQKDEVVAKESVNRDKTKELNEADKAYHKKEMKEMMARYKKDTQELYDRLYADNERFKMEEIDRIAEETKTRLRIVDRDFAVVKRDAITAIYRNLGQEFTEMQTRAQIIEKTIYDLIEYIEPHRDGISYDLLMIRLEYESEVTLFDRKLDKMRLRMNLSKDVTSCFKNALLTPLEDYEASSRNVKNVSAKILKASKENSMKELGPVRESLTVHVRVVSDTIDKMKKLDLKSYVEDTLAAEIQKTIQN